jgi:hypothetical protein
MTYYVLAGILTFCSVLPPTPSLAQDLPIFDAHIHYSQPDWPIYSPEAALAILDKAGVRWALVSSTPDDGTLRLYEKAPRRIVPFLRPYRTQGDMATCRTASWLKPTPG